MPATGYIGELRERLGARPLIVVGAAVVALDAHGRVLLQHRTDDGSWGVVGGALEPGESLEDCARRELREEAGLEAGGLVFLTVLSGPDWFHRYPNGDEIWNVIALYAASDLRGEPTADGAEGRALGFFDGRDPPAMNGINRRILAEFVGLAVRAGVNLP